MSSATYAISVKPTILRHHPAAALTLHDYASFRKPQLDAFARSGDLFTMLATALETISIQLTDDNVAAAQALDSLARNLEYFQRHYAVVTKAAARQLRRDADAQQPAL